MHIDHAADEKAPLPPATDLERYGSDPELVAAYERILGWDEATRRQMERKLVRQLDARIAFPVVVMYVLNYLDRNSIAQGESKTGGMHKKEAEGGRAGTKDWAEDSTEVALRMWHLACGAPLVGRGAGAGR